MSRHILYYGWIAGYLKRNPGGASSSVAYTTTEIPEVGGQLYACDLSFSYDITTVYIDGDSIACNYDAIGEIETTGLTRSPENDIYEEEPEYIVREISVSAFRGNRKITAVDCNEIPWTDDNMSGAFQSCVNLTSITNISKTVTNMSSTFKSCTALTAVPVIPNSVVNASGIFYGCVSLNEIPVLPNLIQDLSYGFAYCTGLTEIPVLPDSISDLSHCFSYCTNITQFSRFPMNIQNLDYTFQGCSNLTVIPEILANTTSMIGTFSGCTNITGDIYIYSNAITNIANCFDGIVGPRNIYIPYNTFNNSIRQDIYTTTYNTFVAAGYDEVGTKDNIYLKNILNLYTVTFDNEIYNYGYLERLGNYVGIPYGVLRPVRWPEYGVSFNRVNSSHPVVNLATDINVVKN